MCDSGSRDDTIAIARSYGARGHRNRALELLSRADPEPAHATVCRRSRRVSDPGFGARRRPMARQAARRVRPRRRRGAHLRPVPAAARCQPDGGARAERVVWIVLARWIGHGSIGSARRSGRFPARALLGPRGFFTDANGCVARAAWDEVPFRQVPYAEDHVLALDMMRAGYAKVFLPDAAVIHSHDYSAWQWLRRSFDEGRALHEVYGFAEPCRPAHGAAEDLGPGRRGLAMVPRSMRGGSAPIARACSLAAGSTRRARLGASSAGRAERLPEPLVRRLSLERRATRRGRG